MWSDGNPLSIRRCVAVGTYLKYVINKTLTYSLGCWCFQALTLLCMLFLLQLCVRSFDRFFIFIWNSVYYYVISQKICFYLVAGFKFFVSNEIRIMIKKVFYSGNSSTKPSSKEDCITISISISLLFHMIVFFIPGLVLSCISLNSNQYCSVLM